MNKKGEDEENQRGRFDDVEEKEIRKKRRRNADEDELRNEIRKMNKKPKKNIVRETEKDFPEEK